MLEMRSTSVIVPQAGWERGSDAGGVDHHADGAGFAGETAFGADEERGVAVDDDFVEGVGVEGHHEVELDEFFSADDALGEHPHAADFAGADVEEFAGDCVICDDGVELFADGVELPAETVGDHGDRLTEADVSDGAFFDEGLDVFERHAGADFFLKLLAAFAGVEAADDLDVFDERAGGGAGEGEGVHGVAGVDAGAEDGDVFFLRGAVESGGE